MGKKGRHNIKKPKKKLPLVVGQALENKQERRKVR
jgi:hypothetical protein